MTYKLELVDGVADVIGVNAYDVEEFLRLSSAQRVLYHGVKRATSLPGIDSQGILPLTPESRGSHWTSGTRTFSNRRDRIMPETFDMYDTPFFCYSNGGLVITDHTALLEKGIPVEWKEDNETVIHVPVPREAITIVTTNGYEPNTSKNGSNSKDRLLFELLLDHLRKYTRGRTITLVNSFT